MKRFGLSRQLRIGCLCLGVLFLSHFAQAQASVPVAEAHTSVMRGRVSFYGAKFDGRKTANGERFDSAAMTMAHRTLPFGTLVQITNPRNKRSVIVRVNDRGPFIAARVGDISRAAAAKLGIIHLGVSWVVLRVVGKA